MLRMFKIIMLGCCLYFVVGALPIFNPNGAYAQEAKTVYVCQTCNFEQADKGNCPTCNSELTKMDLIYECASCGMRQVAQGNCSMCGAALVEKKVPAKS